MRAATVFAMVLGAILSLGGCGFDPASIPVPGSSVPGPSYRVHIQFTNALNLPAKAKVMANGIRVGTLDKVTIVNPGPDGGGYIVANVDIAESVPLPTKTIAQLQQSTILGDLYIGLITPPDGFDETIPADGTIPLSQTRPALQIEDTMAGMATFVQGGVVHEFQEIVNRLNAVLPADPKETERIFGTLTTDLTDVANHLDQVSQFGRATEDLVSLLRERGDTVSNLLTEETANHVVSAASSLVEAVGVLGEIGKIAHALEWIAPLVTAGDAAAAAFVPLIFTSRPFDLSAPSNLNALVALIRDRIIPFVERGPKVNVVGIDTESAPSVPPAEQVDRIVATLRMIGAVR